MSRRKLVSYIVLLLVALGLLTPIGYLFLTRTRGVYLAATNNTSETLGPVEIIYTGGVIHIATLQPKTSYGRRVNPVGESWVKVKWVDSTGNEHSRATNVYIEPNYRGSLEIVIGPGNTVSWINKTRPYFF